MNGPVTRHPVSRFAIVLVLCVAGLTAGCGNGSNGGALSQSGLHLPPGVSAAPNDSAPLIAATLTIPAPSPTAKTAMPTAQAFSAVTKTVTPAPTAIVLRAQTATLAAGAPATKTRTRAASPVPAAAKKTATKNAPVAPTRTPAVVSVPVAVRAADGVHLFLDDYWIAARTNVTRTVMSPRREFEAPVVPSGEGYYTWQSYNTVLYDKKNVAAPFRMWYNAVQLDSQSYVPGTLAYLESQDGIHWNGPLKRIQGLEEIYGASLVDRGANFRPKDKRYQLVYWQWPGEPPRTPIPYGMQRATSPDGLNWTVQTNMPFANMVVNNDIWNIFWDPVRSRYGVFFKDWTKFQWKNAEGKNQDRMVRLVGYTTSANFEQWTTPVQMFVPDAQDSGVTQFYGVGGVQRRGDLLIGFLKILRDDVTVAGAPPGTNAHNGDEGGMGYTVLAWSRDGVTWQRDRAANAFFKPDPQVGAWDHAMAWIDSAVPVNNQVYLYYGGYRWGHKSSPGTERQLGLVRIARDRYVAQTAGNTTGLLVTRPMLMDAEKIWLNVKSNKGRVEFEVRDAENNPLPGFTFADCKPLTRDHVSAQVQCKGKFAALKQMPVRLAFRMQNAQLYGFELK